jgi:phosphotransferase system enzyme I (PtsI)
MDDPYLRTRKDDVIHVTNRVLRILLKQDMQTHNPEAQLEGAIIIADDLTPADTILLQHQHIGAFVTEYGGPMSHTAIMARSLNIPAVLGIHHAREYLRNEETLVVDGSQGIIIADPDKHSLKHYQKQQKEEKKYLNRLSKLKKQPAVTRDGTAISLQANIELPNDIDGADDVNAAGIGLYRTEFLFMNRNSLPEEDEQYQAYRHILERQPDKPVTIRTLDLGADKQSEPHFGGAMPTNPALGLRAVRLCLRDHSLFKPQLRAILRASAHGKCRLMVPMLSNTRELFQVLSLIEEARYELGQEGYDYDVNMPIGGMIEIPAAAISADAFAQHLDFLSIGTNDLIQYTLAIDRIDDEVNYLFDPLHPSVLFLIHRIIEAGNKAGIPVSMCGEMAGDARYTRLLLGLGLREFSMQSSRLLEVKHIISRTDLPELVQPVQRILRCTHTDIAAGLIDNLNKI